MNALPALVPSLVARGPLLWDMTTSALWLHFMGLVVGLIGGVWIVREGVAYHLAVRAAQAALPVHRPVVAPKPASAPASLAPAAQGA